MPTIPRRPPRIPGDLSRGNGTIGLGDSRCFGGGVVASGQNVLGMASWFNWACHLSGGQIRFLRNAGVNSDTTAGALARLSADVIAYRPARCLVCIGTNDFSGIAGATKTLADVQASYRSIVTRLRGAGIDPIICLDPPRATFLDEWGAWNEWLARYAQSLGLKLVDMVTPLIDGATGQMQSAYTIDGVHFTQAGAKVAGQAVADALANYLPADKPHLTMRASDPNNLIANGIFVGDANSDGLADSWSGTGSAGTATRSLVDDADSVGNWQKVAVTVAGQRNVFQSIGTSLWDPGDELEFSGLIDAAPAGGMEVSIHVRCTAGSALLFAPFDGCEVALPTGTRFVLPFTVPANTTAMLVEAINTATGTGTFRVAQLTLRNLTTLGAA